MPEFEVTIKIAPGRLLAAGLGRIEKRTFKAADYTQLLILVREYGEATFKHLSWKMIDFVQVTPQHAGQEK